MASTANSGLGLNSIAKPSLINTVICKLMSLEPSHNLAVGFEGLSADEVADLIDCAIKIEEARTGNVLTPTEYGNRFAGLDLTGGSSK